LKEELNILAKENERLVNANAEQKPCMNTLKDELTILAKENMRLVNANAELAQQRDRNLLELTTLKEEKEDIRRQFDCVQDDHKFLTGRLEREQSLSRRTKDLAEEVATLQGHNDYLESKVRAHYSYGTKLNDQVHLLQAELGQSVATLKDQRPCMDTLKEELTQNQRDQSRLLEDNRRLQCSKNDLEHTVSLLEKDLEERDVLQDRIEQMKMNHALEMGFSHGSIAPKSNMDSLKQELALANGRIRELESELHSSKKMKEELH
jgi:chromosome segregation ATPase